MTAQDALKIMDQIGAAVQTDRKGHETIQEAIKVLQEAIGDSKPD